MSNMNKPASYISSPSKSSKTKFISVKDFIDRTTICRFGLFCRREDCKFKHVQLKTRMCKFSNCARKNCSFAHSKQELYVHPCKFGSKCNNMESCIFSHPSVENVFNPKPTPKIVVEKVPSLDAFPITISKNVKVNSKPSIDYSNMKTLKVDVDFKSLEGDVNTLVEEYEKIKSFKSLSFNLV